MARTSRIAAALPLNGPVTIRIGAPAAPWHTLEEIPVAQLPAESKVGPCTISAIESRDKEIVLSLSGVMDMPRNLRFVLVDTRGRVHSWNSESTDAQDKLPPWGTHTSHLGYQNLPLENVRAVRFETRPEEFAEFQNIPMEPR